MRSQQDVIEKGQLGSDTPGSPDGPPVPPPADTGENPPIETQNQVCYFNADINPFECVDLTEFSAMGSPEDYTYKDPFNDSSFPAGFDKNQYIPPSFLISLNDYKPELLLTPFFQIQELMPLRQGDYGVYSKTVLSFMEFMREDLSKSILIHSAYRSPAYNAGLSGSASWSRHQYGDAIDFHVEGESFEDLKNLCLSYGASFFQIYNSHIHCDWRNTALNKEFYPLFFNIKNKNLNTFKQARLYTYIRVEEDHDHFYLSVESDFLEDHSDEIQVQWKIKYKKKKIVTQNSKTLSLLKKEKPQSVSVSYGGSVELVHKFKK
jgi:hypothetical protein